MSESDCKDSKPDVEDHHAAINQPVEEEDEAKGTLKSVNVIEKDFVDVEIGHGNINQDTGDAVDADGDSEAETLIQSPEKKRNSVADGSTIVHQVKVAGSDAGSIAVANTSDKENATRKRKRSYEEGRHESPSRASSHRSSPLSSPVAPMRSDIDSDDSAASNRRTSFQVNDESDSQNKRTSSKKHRRRPSEIMPPSPSHKRSKRNSIDALERRETRSATYPRPSDDEKSPSPEPVMRREHRRGASTQLTAGEFERKKRGRPPLINTRRNRSADRASNSSEDSGPRSSRARPHLHKFASNDNDTMSPAKVGPRKWKDKNGRTYLARACANNDLEAAKARLVERREDLNIGDNAGNTPLQIASLEGFSTIVGFLLTKGADVNVRNIDKDTPLIDAVENGHVDVIKLLLKHGANPRMGNAKGDEPYELVHQDDEAYDEIRELLSEAKDKDVKKTPGADTFDPPGREGTSSRAASAASPRDSPPAGPRSPPAFGNRRRTGRSESTRNDLLWQANTQENLAKLAGKGDVQGVANILSILEKADTEALIAAAKAGHEEVLQLLIAMGRPDDDPEPVRSSKTVPGYNTPMLAAIGRGHPDVVKLLANQSGFNPTRKYRDKTYYELADDRRGDRWEEEYNILRSAYDRAKGKKSSSPRKTRDERAKPRPRRSSSVNSTQRQMSSPSMTHKILPPRSTESSPKERRKISIGDIEKRKSGGEIIESTIAIASDLDQSVNVQKKGHRTRRSQSDLPPPPALEQEPIYRRRRLLTAKEHRRRQPISPSSDNDDSDMIEVKQEERPQSALKRTRNGSTPDLATENKERKKRKTILESSPEEVRLRTDVSPSLLKSATNSGAEISAGDEQNKAWPDFDEAVQDAVLNQQDDASVTKLKTESPIPDVPKVMDSEALPDADISNDEQKSAQEATVHESSIQAAEQIKADIEEAQRKAKEENDRLAAEQAAQQEAARKAEEERLAAEKAAEEMRLKIEAEAAEKRRQEEEQARKRQEEERLERQRQEMESRRQLELLQQERQRLEALPIVLARTAKMIDEDDPEVRSPQWLNKFLPLYSVRTRQLDPHCNTIVAEDIWVPNFQVASLLATKDLNLLSYTSLERRPVSDHERQCLWRVARLKLSYDFNPLWTTTVSKANEIEMVAQEKFMQMNELFWVKLTDFLEQVPQFPHLNIKLPQQSISLKSYTEILNRHMKTGISQQPHPPLANGIYNINGGNGIT